MKNTWVAMIQEQLGIGTPKYCVEGNSLPGFNRNRMLLLLNYLPLPKSVSIRSISHLLDPLSSLDGD